jgi:hypothetical protein
MVNHFVCTALIFPQENQHFTNKVIDLSCPPLPGTANCGRFRSFENGLLVFMASSASQGNVHGTGIFLT